LRASLSEVASLRRMRVSRRRLLAPPLVRLRSPPANCPAPRVADYWLPAPSTSLPARPSPFDHVRSGPSTRSQRNLEVFLVAPRAARPRVTTHRTPRSLPESRPFQGIAAAPARAPPHLSARGSSITRGPPRVSSPSALSAGRIYVTGPGVPLPVRSVSRDSHPPDGFLCDPPCGLVSSRWRSWGSTLQSFTNPRSRDASRRPMPS
jgi:hypothetical protein